MSAVGQPTEDRHTATSRPLDRGDPLPRQLNQNALLRRVSGGNKRSAMAGTARELCSKICPGLPRNFRQSHAFPADLPTFSAFCSRGAERLEFGKNPFDF